MAGENSLAALKPFKKGARSAEEQKKLASLGGKASAEARRRRRELRKAMQEIMEMPVTGKTKESLAKLGFSEENQTYADGVAATLMSMALNGNMKAMEMVLEYGFKVSEDERKTKESNARIDALAKNGVDITVQSGDEDGGVVIYLPEVESEEANKVSELEEKK